MQESINVDLTRVHQLFSHRMTAELQRLHEENAQLLATNEALSTRIDELLRTTERESKG